MNEQVAKYLERQKRLDDANARIYELQKELRKANSEASAAYFDHINNDGSGSCGGSQFVQRLPDYMVEYYENQGK